jgi:anti-sigma-K factor RskA
VAAALGNSVEPLPEGLWNSIASRLPERGDEAPPPMPRLVPDQSEADTDEGRRRRHRQRSHQARTGRIRMATVASLAVAASAVAVVFGLSLVRADNQVSSLRGAIAETSHTAVVAALDTPGHQEVTLDNAQHRGVATFVLVPGGRGYLVSTHLPKLPSKETYQLWGVIDGQPISVGLMGQAPGQVVFTLAGSPKPSRLAITVEPSGGSVVPSSPMVASGTV